MSALNRKLLRDLWRLKGQVIAVALVIASGTALLIMSLSALSSLRITADAYYQRYGFAEIFANVKRAPERLRERIAAIPGVQSVETRVVAYSTIDVPNIAAPVTGLLISVPTDRQPLLNRIALRAGRMPEPSRTNEAVIHEPFAEAHGLRLGDSVTVLLNGAKRKVRIVGIALSPEYVYAIAPGGLMPDDKHFGLLWMGRKTLAAAYDLDGAFNDISLGLLRGVNPEGVIEHLDPILERYGGTGAIARADQISNWFLMNEFEQLKTQATILPTVFLSVAAFLIYTVLGRVIATERREISLMKAFGYSTVQIGLHYSGLALAIAILGILLGWGIGAWLGQFNTAQFTEFYRFPFLYFRPSAFEFVLSAGIAIGVSLFGALGAVRAAARLQPAEAMRPPAPDLFRTVVVPPALASRLDNPTRMILRQIARTPRRSLITVAGVAMAVGVLSLAMKWTDAIQEMVHSHFHETQHQHMTLAFHERRGGNASFALDRLPGVLTAEAYRVVPARLRAGARSHRGAVTALPQDAHLQVIHDIRGWDLPVPRAGLVLGTMLADKLGVAVGDTVTVEILVGARQTFTLPVGAVFETYIDLPAYMDLSALNRALDEGPSFKFASLLVDSKQENELFAQLRRMPGFSALMIKRNAIDSMTETIGETIMIFVGFFVLFSGALTYGVVYNSTRIALSERARDLATLRVLGFSRWEISYILLGEAGLLVLAALPFGCLAGYGLDILVTKSFETELFRMPAGILPPAFGKAILVALAAGALSAIFVRRRLDSLDLVAVLKTRE